MRYIFFAYLFFELLVSYNIAMSIGFVATFLEIILSAMLGFFLLLNHGSTMRENFNALGELDLLKVQTLNLFSFIGAILLILPGFLTDMIGLALQFGTITNIIINRSGIKSYKQKHNTTKEQYDEIIDVEIISDTSSSRQ